MQNTFEIILNIKLYKNKIYILFIFWVMRYVELG